LCLLSKFSFSSGRSPQVSTPWTRSHARQRASPTVLRTGLSQPWDAANVLRLSRALVISSCTSFADFRGSAWREKPPPHVASVGSRTAEAILTIAFARAREMPVCYRKFTFEFGRMNKPAKCVSLPVFRSSGGFRQRQIKLLKTARDLSDVKV
jgi:hypothetical protein